MRLLAELPRQSSIQTHFRHLHLAELSLTIRTFSEPQQRDTKNQDENLPVTLQNLKYHASNPQ